MPSAPWSRASSNAAMVCSGASAEAPRSAMMSGVAREWSLSRSRRPWQYRGVPTPVLDVARPVIRLGARLYFRIRFEGTEHIPAAGPLLIVPNHVTYSDPVLVSIPVRRPVHYMAWNALFHIPGLAWLIRRLRAFPVELESADPRATREAVRLLQSGAAVSDLPGGRAQSRRSTGALQAGRVSPRVLARRAPAARHHRRRSRVLAARARPAAPGPAHDHVSPGGPAAGRRRRQGRGSPDGRRRPPSRRLGASRSPAAGGRGRPARRGRITRGGGLSCPCPHARCILSRWPPAPRGPSSSCTART